MDNRYTRREFLETTVKAAVAAAIIHPGSIRAAEKTSKPVPALVEFPAPEKTSRNDSAAEKLGWRLSMACYTLRSTYFMHAADLLTALGIKYIDLHPNMALTKDGKVKTDHNSPPEIRQAIKAKLKETGLKMISYGMTSFGATEESARKVFAYVKELGGENVICEAKPELLPMLDKLTEEYGITVALHNHPKPSFYWDPDTVLKAIEGRSKRIGSCADTGHFQRSGLVPLECVQKLKGRIISLHFKDMVPAEDSGKKDFVDVPWGSGTSDDKAMLAELKSQGFKGAFGIEYERTSGKELLDNIARCVAYFDATAAALLAADAK